MQVKVVFPVELNFVAPRAYSVTMTLLDIGQLRRNVTGYKTIQYVTTTGSTNADLLKSGEPGAVLIAGTQTAGHGRLGRQWASPEGSSIALSVLIDDPPVERLGLLPLAMGLAATDTIEGTHLKWPNDVLVEDKKLAGILAQADFSGEAREASAAEVGAGSTTAPRVVIGIGINVNLTADQLPVPHATSLTLAGFHEQASAPTAMVEKLLVAFERRQAQWKAGDTQLLDDYRKACVTIGQDVRLETPAGQVTGRADGVTGRGEIIVEGTAYSAGDITHLRAQLRPHSGAAKSLNPKRAHTRRM